MQTDTRLHTHTHGSRVLPPQWALLQTLRGVKCMQGAARLIINSSVGFAIRREEGSLAQPAVTAIYRSVREKEVDQRRELESV